MPNIRDERVTTDSVTIIRSLVHVDAFGPNIVYIVPGLKVLLFGLILIRISMRSTSLVEEESNPGVAKSVGKANTNMTAFSELIFSQGYGSVYSVNRFRRQISRKRVLSLTG